MTLYMVSDAYTLEFAVFVVECIHFYDCQNWAAQKVENLEGIV